MMNKITNKDLENKLDRINNIAGHKDAPYSTIGAYCLDYAYGGVSLEKWVNDAGGVEDVFGCGHITKRELYNRINAYLLGLRATL